VDGTFGGSPQITHSGDWGLGITGFDPAEMMV
jgi:hypothetical protein